MFNIIRYIKRWWYKSELEKRTMGGVLKPIDEEFELFYLRPLVRTLKDYSWFSHAMRPKVLTKEKNIITIVEPLEPLDESEEVNKVIINELSEDLNMESVSTKIFPFKIIKNDQEFKLQKKIFSQTGELKKEIWLPVKNEEDNINGSLPERTNDNAT